MLTPHGGFCCRLPARPWVDKPEWMPRRSFSCITILAAFSDAFSERPYKIKARLNLEKTSSLEKALTGDADPEQVLSAIRATNMLFSIEQASVRDVLRGREAKNFIHAAAIFTEGDRKRSLG